MAKVLPVSTKIVDAKETSFSKASSSQWRQTERVMDTFNKKVYAELNGLVLQDGSIATKEKHTSVYLKMVGDKYYVSIVRPILMERNVIPKVLKINKDYLEEIKTDDLKKGNKKKDKRKKKDIIIEENKKNKIIETFDKFIDAFISAKKMSIAFISEYGELRLVGLMYSATKLLALAKKVPIESLRDKAFEMIFGSRKAMYYCRQMEGFSKIAIEDHEQLINVLQRKFEFSILDTLKIIPRVIISTNIDNVYPITDVSPYVSQRELMEKIMNNKQFLIYLICMIGTGKTSMISPICKYIEKERERLKASDPKKKLDVIFACSVEPVRIQAGNIAYNNDIKFGFASREKGRLIIRNHYSIGQNITREEGDERRLLTIADLASTLELVRSNKEKGKDSLIFIDEPTVGADQKNHKITRMVMQIIRDSPGRIILSSATMPKPEQVPEINEMFLRKYPSAKIETVISYETKIGCQIMNEDGDVIAPHTSCQTQDELTFQITRLKDNPFLGRIYTPLMLYYLVDRMKSLGIEGLPNLEERFSDFRKLSQIEIQQFAIEVLEILSKCNNKLIKQVCSVLKQESIVNENESDKSSESDSDSDSDSDDIVVVQKPKAIAKGEKRPLVPEKFFLEDSCRFMGGCLIACSDPVGFVLKNGKAIFELVEKEGGYEKMKETFDEAVEKYKKRLADIQKYGRSLIMEDREAGGKNNWKLERRGKEIKKKGKTSQKKRGIKVSSGNNLEGREADKHDAKNEKKLSNSDRASMIEEVKMKLGLAEPIFPFPQDLQINTRIYFTKYFPEVLDNLDESLLRPMINQIPESLGVSDELMILLRAGIGVYSNHNKHLTPRYSEFVLDLASEGKLAFLVSDGSINYGANYHIGHVIVFDDLAKKHSIGTLFQLWGRAGRVGKSWTAHAYIVGKDTERRFMKYMKGELDRGVSMEAKNLVSAMKELIDEEDRINKEAQVRKEEKVKKDIENYEKEKKKMEVQKILAKARAEEEERKKQERIKKRKEAEERRWSKRSNFYSGGRGRGRGSNEESNKNPFSRSSGPIFAKGPGSTQDSGFKGAGRGKTKYVPPHLRKKS